MTEHLNDIIPMFDDLLAWQKKCRKNTYTDAFFEFEKKHEAFYTWANDRLGSEEQDDFCDAVAQAFVKEARARRNGERGKKIAQMDLNLHMVMYVFPGILNTENSNAEKLCESIEGAWNKEFKSKIQHADYQYLQDGFRSWIDSLFSFGKKKDRKKK